MKEIIWKNKELGIIKGNKCGRCWYPEERFIKAKDLKEGNKVMFLAFRGNYDGCKNLNNGWIEIRGVIHIKDTGERKVIPNKKDVEKWEKPIGKEQFKQCFPYFVCHNEKITKRGWK